LSITETTKQDKTKKSLRQSKKLYVWECIYVWKSVRFIKMQWADATW